MAALRRWAPMVASLLAIIAVGVFLVLHEVPDEAPGRARLSGRDSVQGPVERRRIRRVDPAMLDVEGAPRTAVRVVDTDGDPVVGADCLVVGVELLAAVTGDDGRAWMPVSLDQVSELHVDLAGTRYQFAPPWGAPGAATVREDDDLEVTLPPCVEIDP